MRPTILLTKRFLFKKVTNRCQIIDRFSPNTVVGFCSVVKKIVNNSDNETKNDAKNVDDDCQYFFSKFCEKDSKRRDCDRFDLYHHYVERKAASMEAHFASFPDRQKLLLAFSTIFRLCPEKKLKFVEEGFLNYFRDIETLLSKRFRPLGNEFSDFLYRLRYLDVEVGGKIMKKLTGYKFLNVSTAGLWTCTFPNATKEQLMVFVTMVSHIRHFKSLWLENADQAKPYHVTMRCQFENLLASIFRRYIKAVVQNPANDLWFQPKCDPLLVTKHVFLDLQIDIFNDDSNNDDDDDQIKFEKFFRFLLRFLQRTINGHVSGESVRLYYLALIYDRMINRLELKASARGIVDQKTDGQKHVQVNFCPELMQFFLPYWLESYNSLNFQSKDFQALFIYAMLLVVVRLNDNRFLWHNWPTVGSAFSNVSHHLNDECRENLLNILCQENCRLNSVLVDKIRCAVIKP